MPAKDIYHDSLKNALIKDGWTITHDPLVLKWGTKDVYIDLGAEHFLAAEKANRESPWRSRASSAPRKSKT